MSSGAGISAPLTVMYVEDDPVTRVLVAQTLPKKFPHFTIRTAENGKLGLQLYKEYQADIVITDVNMPVMNGILMAAEIKAINPDVVIIAVTAYSETNYLLNAIEIGISHYVLKPIDYKKLFEAIEKSSTGIRLRKQFAEQNKLISELNAALENQMLKIGWEQEILCRFVSHNLTAAIAVVRESVQSLLQSSGSRFAERETGMLANVVQETQKVERFIGRLLDFSKLGSYPLIRTSVDLSGIAENIADRLRRQDPQRRVNFRIARGVVADGDERLLTVAMENLLENAWKYTETNPDAVIEFGSGEHAGAFSCFVRDNGTGFDSQKIAALLPFEVLEEAGGAGLGLATVQRIIQLHGGTLEMAGEPGKGATFTFTF